MRIRTVLLCLSAAAAAGAEPLSLHQAQELLFKNNLDVLTAGVNLQKAHDELDEARSAWWPSLDASASYGVQTEKSRLHLQLDKNQMFPGSPAVAIDRTIGASDQALLGLDLSYPLFTGFSRVYAERGRRRSVAAQEALFQAAKNRASLSLGLLYLQWELSFKQEGLRRALVNQLDAYTKQVAAMREAGAASQSRLLEAQSRLQLASVDLLAAQDQCDSLGREIGSLILIRENAPVPDTAGTLLDTLAAPKKVGLDRPELRALDRASEQISASREILRYRYFPVIAGTAGLRYGRPGLYLGLDRYMGWGLIGLQVKWNLFDGMKTAAQSSELARQIDYIDIERTRQIEALKRSFDQAKRQLNTAASRLAACRAARVAAAALAADLKNALDAGAATTADYLNALVNQAQADLMIEQAKTTKKIALLKMLFAAGKEIKY